MAKLAEMSERYEDMAQVTRLDYMRALAAYCVSCFDK